MPNKSVFWIPGFYKPLDDKKHTLISQKSTAKISNTREHWLYRADSWKELYILQDFKKRQLRIANHFLPASMRLEFDI